MKKITILTLFPDQVKEFLKYSIIARAIKNKIIKVNVINFRDFSIDKHKKVDDYQYGGGGGMVISILPIVAAIKKYKTKNTKVILLSPQAKPYKQEQALKFAKQKLDLILICGHYEGFDARIKYYIDETISIGDYVLTGGELPALVVLDSIARLLDKTISKQSLESESFNDNLLDYDCYTKPLEFEKHKVPEVLLSGNHNEIKKFRLENKKLKTKKIRPDLIKKI